VEYIEAVNFLFNQLANYQKVGESAYKPGLKNVENLLSALNNPHHDLKTIHIAGTNGKGSVSHILASILIENGYKVGLYTSPHIKDFRERIKINGKLISKQEVTTFVIQNKSHFENLNPSFFEITTAMAFSIFKKHKCDISIIETGLGGRLDSTNVILPEVSVITNIGIDHTNFLGTTLKQIATEKAGIIKPNTPVVIGEFNPITFDVFKQKSKETHSQLTLMSSANKFNTDLLGMFQQKNINLAIQTIQTLQQKGWYIDSQKTNNALLRIKKNTNFIGRLDQISVNPRIIVDASHNVDGIKNFFAEIKQLKFNKLHCIYATSSDKDVAEIMKLFPKSAHYYFTTFNSERSLNTEDLKTDAIKNNLKQMTFANPNLALNTAKENYRHNDLIVVFGSFFLLEKII